MQKFLKLFLIGIAGYHLIVTCIGFGIMEGKYPQIWPLFRDAVWCLFIIYNAILRRKQIKKYRSQWRQLWIRIGILIIFSLWISYLKGKSVYDMFVGIKYGLLYLPTFLSTTFIGYLRAQEKETYKVKPQIYAFFTWVKYFLITVLMIGFLRQITKFIWPDFFLHIGYGPLDDFKFGIKPPMYYLTGYQGTWRRQWIFSWPNNYGYFLIAMLPLIVALCKNKRNGIKEYFHNKHVLWNGIFILLWIIAILCSLSRSARIGGIVVLALLNIQWIKGHKKIAISIAGIAILGLIGLSALKGTSTLAHIQAKFGSIHYVLQRPSGYGLGTSWPAIHYNGTILPENYYIQLMLDIWALGFLLRALCIRQRQRINNIIKKYTKDKDEYIYRIRRSLSIGWVALLVMGLFLHVFEDSMANYIFFVLRGISSGYLLNTIKK